jgi:hypothetical protein
MTNKIQPVSALQKFRKTYPRVDYFPDTAAYKVIQQMQRTYPGKSNRELIDALVCAGGKAYFPEMAKC